MRIIECIQGSDEWLQIRAGKVTASRMSDVLAKIKSGEAAGRRNYREDIVAEILTGAPAMEGFASAEMRNGIEQEPFARASYEIANNVMVDTVGFVLHPTIDRAGASPDGLVNSHGLVEIKCPKTSTHLRYLQGKIAPSEYLPQMQWQMACTGRQWNDFISYDPRLPSGLQLFVMRVQRDDKLISCMELEVIQFLKEVDEVLANLNGGAAPHKPSEPVRKQEGEAGPSSKPEHETPLRPATGDPTIDPLEITDDDCAFLEGRRG